MSYTSDTDVRGSRCPADDRQRTIRRRHCVYRTGSDHLRTQFFDELSTLLEMLVVYACPVLVGGDFNVNKQNPDDPGAVA